MWICKSNPILCLWDERFCYKLSWPLNSIRKIVKNCLSGPSLHKLKNKTKRPRGVGTCSESQPFHAHGIKEVKYVDKGNRLHMLQDVVCALCILVKAWLNSCTNFCLFGIGVRTVKGWLRVSTSDFQGTVITTFCLKNTYCTILHFRNFFTLQGLSPKIEIG